MTDEIFFDGVQYILAADAGKNTGLTRDYVTRLCREDKVSGKQVGKNWYVSQPALQSFLLIKEHEQAIRSEELADKLAREYQAVQNQRSFPVKPNTPKPHPFSGNQYAPLNAPQSGASGEHSAAQNVLAASSPINPAIEFAHKLTALVVALALTLGTYAMVDTKFAQYAEETMQNTFALVSNPARVLSLGENIKGQLAAAALDPSGTFTGMMSNLARSFNSGVDNLARSFNSTVDNSIYAIAFPDSLTQLPNSFSGTRGTVAVSVSPYSPNGTSTTSPTLSASSSPWEEYQKTS